MKRLFLLFFLNFSLSINAQTFFNFESGLFFIGFNDIRYGNNGTLFSLKNDLPTPSSPFLRLRAGYLLNNKHHFSVLYAPLKTLVAGILSRNILFDGKDFKANIPLEAIYKFNSYRFTYNRRILIKNNFILGIGVSAKIRDAGISLKNEEVLSENFSVGLIPLMNILANWNISQKTNFEFLGEGVVANKGRAIDISLSGSYKFTNNFKANMGYRLLEGGVDGSDRYNFIQLHFVFASLKFSFNKSVK